jgi:UDP-glucuronate 4-epimerase
MRILVTGAAGFIGAHLVKQLRLNASLRVLGVDSYSNYYSTELKKQRVRALLSEEQDPVFECDLANEEQIDNLLSEFQPQSVIHLAAQAGVRLSLNNFNQYTMSNLVSFTNIIKASVKHSVSNFLYASSSSVYGNDSVIPLSETERNLRPNSFYGATKLSNEIMASTFAMQYGIKVRGLRLFTVYGPWGRPDMAYFRILSALQHDETFQLNGDGSVKRDFTFIDDVIDLIDRLHVELNNREEQYSDIVNIGGGSPHSLLDMVRLFEDATGSLLKVNQREGSSLDARITHANSELLRTLVNHKPFTPLTKGVQEVIEWGMQPDVQKSLRLWVDSSHRMTF